MNTLLIRLPPRATHDGALATDMPACLFALVSAQGKITRHGCEPLSSLAAPIAEAERVVLLIAAADVTLLSMHVPPLPIAKLKVALPHLVEDHILADPDDCVIVAGMPENNAGDKRQIAVVQRDWLELLAKTLSALGAHNLQALPAQLCLPWQEDGTVAAITEHGIDVEVTLRLSAHHGIGWLACPASSQSTSGEMMDNLRAVAPQQAITLYVPAASHAAYSALNAENVTVLSDDWSHWVSATQNGRRNGTIDLMAALDLGTAGTRFNWRNWRWPLALATAMLLVNIAGLNFDWWRMHREASQLRADMMHSYRTAYPTETVIVDPVAQTKQKITLAERASGQFAADDFLVLVTRFSEAWAAATQKQASDKTIISGLEYRDHRLLVRLKDAVDADIYRAAIKTALAADQLNLTEPEAGVWQIGSDK